MEDFDVFISYHWRDHATVELLAHRLSDAGMRVFFDRWYLRPGTNWLHALEANLARCSAVAVCTGKEIGSWQQREAYAALDRQVEEARNGKDFPVIPVLLPGAEAPLGFLRQNTWVDLRERTDDPQRLEILTKAIRGVPPGPQLQDTIDRLRSGVCPYRGLLYFREEDAPFYCGREAAITELVEAVGSRNLVAVVGASGSGKSSLVQAGLVPALRRRPTDAWEIVTLVPGDRPIYNLSAALIPLLEPEKSEVARLGEIQSLAKQLEAGEIQLRDVVRRILDLQPGTQQLLLVVDQWEELFTLTGDDPQSQRQRQRFIDDLLEATVKSSLSVVLTLRGDYFGRAVTSQRALSDRLQGAQVNLGPMTEEELRRAIVEPAKQVGLDFEPNLVELILKQAVGEPGHLPLLEFVLRELWEQRRGRTMHRGAYEDMGQLEGAIATRAELLFDELTRDDPKAEQRIRSIFLRLVRPGEGEKDTRRRALLAEFDAPTSKLIEHLSKKRLLVNSASTASQSPTVEVAHEALIAHWSRLSNWVVADREFMAWRQRLGDEAAEWDTQQRAAGLLLQGLRLAQAQDWLRRRHDDLSKLERTYIKASAKRRKLVVTAVSTAASIGALAIVGFGMFARTEQQNANAARERAEGLVEYMVFDLRDILAPLGRLDLMAAINERVNNYYEELGDADSFEFQRRRSAGLANYGDTLAALGKLDAAREAYDQSLEIFERLLQADASNTRWQRDLSVSYSKLGELEMVAGKLDAARRAYQQALPIAERLAQADASNTVWQRDLSVSYLNLGDVEVAAGKLDAARKTYEQALTISERLAQSDASNIGWQRDLSVGYDRLGDVELAAGRLDVARKTYKQALAISERLAKADVSNTQQQRDLSVSYQRLGAVDREERKFKDALARFEQSYAIADELRRLDPINLDWRNDLEWVREQIATVRSEAARQK